MASCGAVRGLLPFFGESGKLFRDRIDTLLISFFGFCERRRLGLRRASPAKSVIRTFVTGQVKASAASRCICGAVKTSISADTTLHFAATCCSRQQDQNLTPHRRCAASTAASGAGSRKLPTRRTEPEDAGTWSVASMPGQVQVFIRRPGFPAVAGHMIHQEALDL